MASMEVGEEKSRLRRNEAPLVSAIVLSWNRKDETLSCLVSLSRQTYPNIEVIVLDNNSTDNSVQAIRDSFPETRLICMPANVGDWQGRDIAAANCAGKYMLEIDSDAELEPEAVEQLVVRMKEDPQLAVVQPRIIDTETSTPYDMGFGYDKTDLDHYRAIFHGCVALIRLSAFRAAGGFPHYLLGGGEPYLSYRLLDRGYRILYFTGTTARHAMSPRQRIPKQRYFLQNTQRIRAIMANYPGLARPMLELCWKLTNYTYGAVLQGYLLQLPGDLVRQTCIALRAWFDKPKIRRETVHLIDYLHCNMVTTVDDYEKIDTGRSYLWSFMRRRLCRARMLRDRGLRERAETVEAP